MQGLGSLQADTRAVVHAITNLASALEARCGEGRLALGLPSLHICTPAVLLLLLLLLLQAGCREGRLTRCPSLRHPCCRMSCRCLGRTATSCWPLHGRAWRGVAERCWPLHRTSGAAPVALCKRCNATSTADALEWGSATIQNTITWSCMLCSDH